MPPTALIPWASRVRLAHAVVQATADRAGIDALLVKGYATDPRLYHHGRSSSDVDVLVRPCQVEAMITALRESGWETVATFWSGSIFHHAQTMRHEAWGLVDIHRAFPGMDDHPERAFELLWQERVTLPVAQYPCTVPSLLDQALVITVHAARNPLQLRQDVGHLQDVLGPADWRAMGRRAERLGARLALAAAGGRLHKYRHHPAHDLWVVMSQGGSRSQEWRARLRASRSLRQKAAVVLSAPLPNLDHLRMDLQREPTGWEVVRATATRPWSALRELLTGKARPSVDHGAGTQDLTFPEVSDTTAAGEAMEDASLPRQDESDMDLRQTPHVAARDRGRPFRAFHGEATTEPGWRHGPDVAVVDRDSAELEPPLTAPVVLARVPDGVPLLLEDSGAVIWRAAVSVGRTEIVQRVAEAVGLPASEIRGNVDDFVAHLVDQGLLQPRPGR